jgi:RimJ/RimL family protein N-acetyltransferase
MLEQVGSLPKRILGPRLCLRPYRDADAPGVWEALRESHEHLAPWMPWTDYYDDEAEVLDYLQRARAVWEQRLDLPLGIFARAGGRFLGGTGLHRLDWEQRHFEIGYWLRLGELGQGYARETVALLARFAFRRLGATRVEVRVRRDNWRSRRVPAALGLGWREPTPDERARQDEDLVVYELEPAQFAALPWARARDWARWLRGQADDDGADDGAAR